MATFLYRAEHRGAQAGPPVRVPTDGAAVVVPPGQPFVAEFDTVTVEAPAGALSDGARLRMRETSVGTRGLAEDRVLVADPIALSVTGARIVEPLTIRIETDTDSLTSERVVPAYWSSELGAWVPIAAESIDVTDGEIVVRATLSDAEPVSASDAALGPTVMAGGGVPSVAAPAAVVIGVIKFFVAVTATVTVVALTSSAVRDFLADFFGQRVDDPCPSPSSAGVSSLPLWVDGVSDSDEARSEDRAPRLYACGERDGDYLRVRVANNRNYGIQLKASPNDHPVSLASGKRQGTAIEQIVKGLAERQLGDSYLWPLSESDFLLPQQRGDWRGEWGPTWETALVDVLRLALDLLFTVVLPNATDSLEARRFECVRQVVNDGPVDSFDVGSQSDWMRAFGLVSNLLKNCLLLDTSGQSVLAEDAAAAVKHVVNALGKLSVANSAINWGITFADALSDLAEPGAWIGVDINDSARGVDPPTGPGRNSEPFSELTAGSVHTCALRADKTVACWGANQDDQYNHGQADPPSGTFEAISAGTYHSCAVRTTGAIECWGDDSSGQASPPSVRAFKGVTSGNDHSCGLRRDKTITCWGDDTHGQRDAPPGEFLAVSADGDRTCAVRVSGAGICWGAHGPQPERGFFDAVYPASGSGETYGLRTDGTIECWGVCLGNDDHLIGTFAAFDTFGNDRCSLRIDSTITCWGVNFNTASTTTGTAVTMGSLHFCWRQADRSIHCAGQNDHGQADVPADLASDPESREPQDRPASRIAYTVHNSDFSGDELWVTDTDGSYSHKLADVTRSDVFNGWSPDGRHLTYTTSRQRRAYLWIADGDGSDPRLLGQIASISGFGGGLQWSPDGKHLAYLGWSTARGRSEILIADADGSAIRQLTADDDTLYRRNGRPVIVQWSPAGQHLAYRSGDELWVANGDGSGARKLTGRNFIWQGWSPDGQHLAYVEGSGLWVADVDRSGARKLTTDRAGHTLVFVRSAWSPDGRHLAYTVGMDSDSDPDSFTDIQELWAADGDGSGARKLADLASAEVRGSGLFLGWSPNGQHLAYQTIIDSDSDGLGDISELWVANGEGSGARKLAGFEVDAVGVIEISGSFLGWSPDGQHLAYCVELGSDDLGEVVELWVAGGDGSGPRKLASRDGNVNSCTSPVWSPDGRHLVYTVGIDSDSDNRLDMVELWVADGDGSRPRKLGDLGRAGGFIGWSPDRQHLAYYAEGGSPGSREIWIADVVGSDTRMLADVTRCGRCGSHGGFKSYAENFRTDRPIG